VCTVAMIEHSPICRGTGVASRSRCAHGGSGAAPPAALAESLPDDSATSRHGMRDEAVASPRFSVISGWRSGGCWTSASRRPWAAAPLPDTLVFVVTSRGVDLHDAIPAPVPHHAAPHASV
jgi:hypothetical protein